MASTFLRSLWRQNIFLQEWGRKFIIFIWFIATTDKFVGPRTSIKSIQKDAVRETRRGGENRNTRFKGTIHANSNEEGVGTKNIPRQRKKIGLYSSEANPDSLEAIPSDL